MRSLIYVTVFILMLTVAGAAQESPSLALKWTAEYTGQLPIFSSNLTIKLVFDLEGGRFSQSFQGIKPGGTIHGQHLFRKDARHVWELDKSGLCFPQVTDWETARYIYGFGWLKDATWEGHKRSRGAECDVWKLHKAAAYNWSACLTSDGIPVEYSMVPDPREVGSTLARLLALVSLESVGFSKAVDVADLEESPACKQWPTPPCADKTVEKLSAYRMCSTCFDNPGDENAGDLKGELSAICGAASDDGFLVGASHIVKYDLFVNQSFGPYQMFNYAPNKHASVGSKGIGNLVGKSENPVLDSCSLEDHCGQCTTNADGNWLSFPAQGKCGPGQAVGTGGCTWSVDDYAMKNLSCVGPRIKAPCVSYLSSLEHRSEPETQKKFKQAIEDITRFLDEAMAPEAEGGCPDLRMRSTSGIVVV